MALSKIDVANMLTGSTPVANGGTGLTSGTTNQFLKFTGSTTLASAEDNQGGITMADQWRLTTSFSGDANVINSNWERNDTDFAQIGTGLTESSGIFTFPETGIYKIDFQHYGTTESNNPTRYNEAHIRVTTNNSSYNSRATTSSLGINIGSSNGQFTNYCSCIVDVTNTSNVKVGFMVEVADNGTSTIGFSDRQGTGITVIRLGDT